MRTITLLLALLTLASCSKYEMDGDGQLQIAFAYSNDENLSKEDLAVCYSKTPTVMRAQLLTDGACVFITANLTPIEGGFITDKMLMPTARYRLDRLYLMDDQGNTILETKYQGYSMYQVVSHPFYFGIAPQKLTSFPVDVYCNSKQVRYAKR